MLLTVALSATAGNETRALWASINKLANASTYSVYGRYNGRVLISWRMLPGDGSQTAFDIYRKTGREETKLNSVPISGATCFVDSTFDDNADITYRLTYAGSNETLDTHTIASEQLRQGLPYITIPLASTASISTYPYEANDASVGDLDGDGQPEIVVKRLIHTETTDGGEGAVDRSIRHTTLWEAYKLDGTMLWRICGGPNIILGNGASFAIDDFDGDGKAEMAIRTSEGTVFGDGTEIGDENGDGKTDYREDGKTYIGSGPEYLSIIDGTTGRELARTNYIARENSETWGDSYFKRASSYRVGVGNFSGNLPSILICRGVYGRSVLEAWDFQNGSLTRRWRFDTNDDGNAAYAAQGYHSLSTGDVDGDGLDEVVYGSCTIDHDGTGLNTCGYGHGDALHLGKFDPRRDGLQIWSCFETGSVGAAFRDAATGDVIWQYDDSTDVGRCMVADIDPRYPGCEMWWFRGNVHSCDGEDLGYKPASCNMAIWWTGDRNRQLLNGTRVDHQKPDGKYDRAFSVYRYDAQYVNGTKNNPAWYGDMLGDWREEMIFPDTTFTKNLKVFSTWYPSDLRQPWLMTDHVYRMSAINENIGYNQPTHLGYYFGSDNEPATGISELKPTPHNNRDDGKWYNLMGQEVPDNYRGICIHNGKKYFHKERLGIRD